MNVGVNADSGNGETQAKDEVCRLSAHSRHDEQGVAVRRNDSVVLIPNDARYLKELSCFGAIEAAGVDELCDPVLGQGEYRVDGGRNCHQPSGGGEGHLIAGAQREDRGNQNAKRVAGGYRDKRDGRELVCGHKPTHRSKDAANL